jgi:hypothetical protein
VFEYGNGCTILLDGNWEDKVGRLDQVDMLERDKGYQVGEVMVLLVIKLPNNGF